MMESTLDYFLVLKDTAALKRGAALNKMTITGQTFYGLDRRNNFWTEKFLRNNPDTFEYAGDRYTTVRAKAVKEVV